MSVEWRMARLREDTRNALKEEAERAGVSMSDYVDAAISLLYRYEVTPSQVAHEAVEVRIKRGLTYTRR